MFPDNIVQMTFMQYESRIVPKYKPSGLARTSHSVTKANTTQPSLSNYSVNNTINETTTKILNLTDMVQSNITQSPVYESLIGLF